MIELPKYSNQELLESLQEYQKEITCKIDLSEFTYKEQLKLLKIKEIEFEDDYYYPIYIGMGKNKKDRKDVA